MFLQNVADSIYAIAYSLDAYLQQECNSSNEICPKILQTTGTNELSVGVFETMKSINITGNIWDCVLDFCCFKNFHKLNIN